MRTLLIPCCLLALAGCGTSPQALGITGPGHSPPPRPAISPDQQPDATPGVTVMGTTYGPTRGPQTGSSGFWNYNE